MTARTVTSAQANRARREMLAAIDICRRQGMTRTHVLALAGSMYDFNVRFAEAGLNPPADADPPRRSGRRRRVA